MHEAELEGRAERLTVLVSELLVERFRHGFTTRRGGVSSPPFDTLNLGGRWGDRPDAVAENHRRVRETVAGGADLHFALQVHGAGVVAVGPGQAPAVTGGVPADALVSSAPGTAVGVLAADCVPILVGDLATGACAAVHAGWRGTVAGALRAALGALLALPGSRPDGLRVAIGPSIGPCCFEVGSEVVAEVEAAFGTVARREGAIRGRSARGREHLDLWLLNALAARTVGVAPAQIDVAGLCTSCGDDRFFSYRRDLGRTGLQGAVIVCP